MDLCAKFTADTSYTLYLEMINGDVKSSSWPRPQGPKTWPRDYWPWPHDSCGLGLVQLGLVAS